MCAVLVMKLSRVNQASDSNSMPKSKMWGKIIDRMFTDG